MTRIPLNASVSRNEQYQQRLEMSTAEIGLSVAQRTVWRKRESLTVCDLLHSTRKKIF